MIAIFLWKVCKLPFKFAPYGVKLPLHHTFHVSHSHIRRWLLHFTSRATSTLWRRWQFAKFTKIRQEIEKYVKFNHWRVLHIQHCFHHGNVVDSALISFIRYVRQVIVANELNSLMNTVKVEWNRCRSDGSDDSRWEIFLLSTLLRWRVRGPSLPPLDGVGVEWLVESMCRVNYNFTQFRRHVDLCNINDTCWRVG